MVYYAKLSDKFIVVSIGLELRLTAPLSRGGAGINVIVKISLCIGFLNP